METDSLFGKSTDLSESASLSTQETVVVDELVDDYCETDTEIVVIGNGPAGLSLSAFLSGWQPFYDVNKPHPNPRIHEKLAQNADKSLLNQDLTWFEQEFEEIINPTVRPVAFLIDMLMRPKNCLRFERETEKEIAHVVLGETDIGGSWNEYDDEMVTVSLAEWLDLPGFTIQEWLQGQPLIARLPAGVVREYMKAYAKHMNLMDKMQPQTKVTTITKTSCNGEKCYRVFGEDHKGKSFLIRCRKIVLACGQSRQRHLEVEGEMTSPNVVYDVAQLKKVLHTEDPFGKHEKIIVIGDGISAADAVNMCLKNELPVLQVMRRTDQQLKQTMLSKLSSSIYPEYASAYKLMTGKTNNDLYQKLTSSSVVKLNKKTATIQTADGLVKEKFHILVACIGRQSELSMFSENLVFNADYKCESDNHIFAVGSLVGDHFIRYLVGGCLQVASVLLAEYPIELRRKQFKIVQDKMVEQLRQVEQQQKRLRRKPATARCCWISRILSSTS
uniref:Uncharacterized protein n=1 Tax=Panagrolaimus sp. JU765 TaxID=591449 RepID=A0AC34Q2P1_9BILA